MTFCRAGLEEDSAGLIRTMAQASMSLHQDQLNIGIEAENSEHMN